MPAAPPTCSRGPTSDEELIELLRWADDAGARGRGRRLGIQPPGLRRGRARAGAEARRGAELGRAGGDPCCLRRRRPAALCDREGRAVGADRAGVRDQHPGDGRWSGADERQRLRRRAGRVLEWVDVCTPGGPSRRTPEDLGFSYRRSNLRPGEVVARASFGLAEGDVDEIKATLAAMRAQRREAQPSGIKTFGSTFKNPAEAGGGPDCRTAARGGGLPGASGRRRAVLAQACELRGERRGGDDRGHPGPDGGGQAAGARGIRCRAGPRGAGTGRPRVARRLGSRGPATESPGRSRPGRGRICRNEHPRRNGRGQAACRRGSSRSPARPKSSRKPPTKRSPRSRPTARSRGSSRFSLASWRPG